MAYRHADTLQTYKTVYVIIITGFYLHKRHHTLNKIKRFASYSLWEFLLVKAINDRKCFTAYWELKMWKCIYHNGIPFWEPHN